MNLDTLKEQWGTYDKQLEKSEALNLSPLQQSGLRMTRSTLSGLSLGVVAELLMGIVVVILLGLFIGNHLSQPAFLLPALALQLFALFQLVFALHQLVTINRLDYSQPILTSQKRLATLRIQRIRVTMWTFLLSPLLWVPLLIVMLKGLLGVNTYTTFNTAWLVSNLLFGLAVIPIMLWVCKRFAHYWQNSPLTQRLMDDIAGRNLSEAVTFLGQLARFENEGLKTD